MARRPLLVLLPLFLIPIGAFAAETASTGTVSITALGAVSGSERLATAVIQQAIDRASAAGGGTVVIPSGRFVAAPIQLRSHVTLRLERGAVLQCADDPSLSRGAPGFVFADNAEDVGLEGPGTIDGNGRIYEQRDNAPGRPRLVDLRQCRNVTVRDLTLRNAGSWTCRLRGCDGVQIHAVRIHSHQGYNNDGIDIDSRNVAISDCLIDCDDDAICFKSDDPTPCENVTVTNCVAASNCNLIKFGTASVGGFRNITVSNCSLHAASEDHRRQWQKHLTGIALPTTGISGIALEVVDGGTLDQVCLTNITMSGIQTPVFIRLGGRRNEPGRLRQVVISNVTARTESLISSSITGIPGHEVEGVTLRDIRVEVLGRGTAEMARRAVPEKEKSYPENRMFGDSLPAYGLYMRHARGVTLENVQFVLREPDARPALVLADAHDITVRDLRATPPTGSEALLRVERSDGVVLTGFRSSVTVERLIELHDASRDAVVLLENDLANVRSTGLPVQRTP